MKIALRYFRFQDQCSWWCAHVRSLCNEIVCIFLRIKSAQEADVANVHVSCIPKHSARWHTNTILCWIYERRLPRGTSHFKSFLMDQIKCHRTTILRYKLSFPVIIVLWKIKGSTCNFSKLASRITKFTCGSSVFHHTQRKKTRSDSVLWQKPLYQQNIKKKQSVTTQTRHQKLRLHNDCGPT